MCQRMTAREARRLAVEGYKGILWFRFKSLVLGLLAMGLLPYLYLCIRGGWR